MFSKAQGGERPVLTTGLLRDKPPLTTGVVLQNGRCSDVLLAAA